MKTFILKVLLTLKMSRFLNVLKCEHFIWSFCKLYRNVTVKYSPYFLKQVTFNTHKRNVLLQHLEMCCANILRTWGVSGRPPRAIYCRRQASWQSLPSWWRAERQCVWKLEQEDVRSRAQAREYPLAYPERLKLSFCVCLCSFVLWFIKLFKCWPVPASFFLYYELCHTGW